MRRRGRSGSPFTLFSFQDIITSVTGVILFVTLMLLVELSQRTLSAGSPNSETAHAAASDRTNELSQLRAEIAALEKQLSDAQARVVGAAGTTPQQLEKEDRETRDQIKRLQQEIAALQQRRTDAEGKVDDAAKQSGLRVGDRDRLKELQQQAEANRRESNRLKSSDTLVFNPPPGTSKHAWLVVVSGRNVRAIPSQAGWVATEFSGETAQSLAAKCLRWAEGLSQKDHYFVLLIRPSGIEIAKAMEEGLPKEGFDLGLDLIGEEQSVEFVPRDQRDAR